MPELLAVSDYVTKQQAVCVVCGAPATKSQRVHPHAPVNAEDQEPSGETKEQVLVGAQKARGTMSSLSCENGGYPSFLETPRIE